MKKGRTFIEGLSKILVQRAILSQKEVDALASAFERSDGDAFDDFLVQEGLVDEHALLEALGQYYQVPYFEVIGHFFDTHLLQKFPKEFLLQEGIIPLEVDENILMMVASSPDDSALLEKIGEYVSYDIQFMVGLRTDIEDAIKEFYEKSITEGMEDDIYATPEMSRAEERKEFEHELDEDEPLIIYEPSDDFE
ncbi:MAG TPA: hypothetical protein VEK38_03910 [Candidatus Bathyarchaeia archaeon]|nr:hypothetical protein [Candidatus Bathyarchaeia archaeon]